MYFVTQDLYNYIVERYKHVLHLEEDDDKALWPTQNPYLKGVTYEDRRLDGASKRRHRQVREWEK